MNQRWRGATTLALLALFWLGASAQPRAAESPTPDRPSDAEALGQAIALLQQGYLLHRYGEYQSAVRSFRRSIVAYPTAEGHTFLGWSLSHLGRLEEAIEEAEKAIPLDPGYGNTYNDIGVYLSKLGRHDEAIPWLKKAMRSKRYCCYQFPHFCLTSAPLGQIEVIA